MPFKKGKPKTGGRQKGSVNAARKSTRFNDRLRGYGFNYEMKMAEMLKELCAGKAGPDRLVQLRFMYGELKELLPYMFPKLREKEVEQIDTPEAPVDTTPMSDEDLMKAASGKPIKNNERERNTPTVGTSEPSVQVPPSAAQDIPDVAGEQKEN